MAAISTIRNLGPASEASFAKAGLTTAEELYALGAHEAYRRLLAAGQPPHFIGYYVLVMALQGRPWNDCKGAEKAALRAKFDALKAEVEAAAYAAPPGAKTLPRPLDQALRAIGVIPA
ncbi:TfoX/Sxy family protein [Stagnihabitans tardus]|uniref:Competence protein TfoX n=1 Tax=Stagnihabitans tardus TaxID=2699202 RepID=A0AAE5BTU3_9RHOB|nr:TfoX/Sxy family protein [Stagnihabitans tardus]NBZ86074.1 competence protein TfoX [Stagnihabitans tardus]